MKRVFETAQCAAVRNSIFWEHKSLPTCSLSTAMSHTKSSLSRIAPSAWDLRQRTFTVCPADCTVHIQQHGQ